jgi:hypothetical protein
VLQANITKFWLPKHKSADLSQCFCH